MLPLVLSFVEQLSNATTTHCLSKHIPNATVPCVRQHKHLLQYLKSQQLTNGYLLLDLPLTDICCCEEGKSGQRSEATAATNTRQRSVNSELWSLYNILLSPLWPLVREHVCNETEGVPHTS